MDSGGNVYVGGHTWGSIDGYTKSGTLDGIVAKYDANGNKLWSRQVGGGQVIFQGAAVDSSGNAYFGGLLSGTLDGKSSGSSGVSAAIVKYDSGGNRLGTEILGSYGSNKFWGMAADSGSVYAAGEIGSSVSGQSFAGGQGDMVVAKYSKVTASVSTPTNFAAILKSLSAILQSLQNMLGAMR